MMRGSPAREVIVPTLLEVRELPGCARRVLLARLKTYERVIAKAEANGWVRQSEMNARKRTNLINIVTTVEASHGWEYGWSEA
jgi:hypothetical protein